jgi:hypothetical protein
MRLSKSPQRSGWSWTMVGASRCCQVFNGCCTLQRAAYLLRGPSTVPWAVPVDGGLATSGSSFRLKYTPARSSLVLGKHSTFLRHAIALSLSLSLSLYLSLFLSLLISIDLLYVHVAHNTQSTSSVGWVWCHWCYSSAVPHNRIALFPHLFHVDCILPVNVSCWYAGIRVGQFKLSVIVCAYAVPVSVTTSINKDDSKR